MEQAKLGMERRTERATGTRTEGQRKRGNGSGMQNRENSSTRKRKNLQRGKERVGKLDRGTGS